jgi:hypothetical protein
MNSDMTLGVVILSFMAIGGSAVLLMRGRLCQISYLQYSGVSANHIEDVVDLLDVVRPPIDYVLDCCTPNGVTLPIRGYVNWARVEMGLEPYHYIREPSTYQIFEQKVAAYEAHKYIAATLGEECK